MINMNHIKLLFHFAVCIAVCLTIEFSGTPLKSVHAGGFDTKGLGSRQLSMGGATLGLADDWSAIFWNPAGLAFLKGSEFIIEGHGMIIHQDASVSLRNISLPNFLNQPARERSQNFLKGDNIKWNDFEPDYFGNQNILYGRFSVPGDIFIIYANTCNIISSIC